MFCLLSVSRQVLSKVRRTCTHSGERKLKPMKTETNLGNGKKLGALLMLLSVARAEENPLEVESYYCGPRKLITWKFETKQHRVIFESGEFSTDGAAWQFSSVLKT